MEKRVIFIFKKTIKFILWHITGSSCFLNHCVEERKSGKGKVGLILNGFITRSWRTLFYGYNLNDRGVPSWWTKSKNSCSAKARKTWETVCKCCFKKLLFVLHINFLFTHKSRHPKNIRGEIACLLFDKSIIIRIICDYRVFVDDDDHYYYIWKM